MKNLKKYCYVKNAKTGARMNIRMLNLGNGTCQVERLKTDGTWGASTANQKEMVPQIMTDALIAHWQIHGEDE
jgi:hypothetical protein